MQLLVQPEEGIAPLIGAIERARSSIEVAIFRCDRGEVLEALAKAVQRGVFVHALIASTNRNGEKQLRTLEKRLLGAGATVARTSDDLVRYHDKFLIVDRRVLYLLAFNFTSEDIERSRSFGVVTSKREFVQEAVNLFEADVKRHSYVPGLDAFVVSPLNSRTRLASLIQASRQELLIYDPKLSDREMAGLLEERAAAGVTVKIIGQLSRKRPGLVRRKLAGLRLHTRTIIRDGREAFIGSQSLRAKELDQRREAGIILEDRAVVERLVRIFHADWAVAEKHKAEKAAGRAF